MDNNERVLLRFRLSQVLASPGWSDVLRLMEQSITTLERQAIDEEDDVKGNNLRREARAARRFFQTFTRQLSLVSDPVEPGDDGWVDVVM